MIRVIKSRRMRWAGYVSCINGRDEKSTQNFSPKTESKKSLGRPRRRWEDNIKMNLKEKGNDFVSWIHLARKRGP
jgi:hypothetical protein